MLVELGGHICVLFNAAPLLLHILSLVRYRVKMEIKQQQHHMLPFISGDGRDGF